MRFAKFAASIHELALRPCFRAENDLPLDHLKIDGSFVAGVTSQRADRAIVTACVQLAEALGMVAVAECVETHDQLTALADLGCHVTQGYWLAAPDTAAALRDLLTRTGRGHHAFLGGPT